MASKSSHQLEQNCPEVPWKLYFSRLVSSWGDRMWMFAVGLFMIELSPGSLKWPAIYGLTRSLAVVFFGPLIGRWVDRNPRWRAARFSLTWQSATATTCALSVAMTFYFRIQLENQAHSWGAWGLTFACSLIAALGSIGRLAALASTIVIQKDWTAVLANGDEAKLARMNSTCRSIDLATNIIAPLAVGQIIYFVSHFAAAMMIASWNVIFFVVELLLLWKTYNEYPKLAVKDNAEQLTSGDMAQDPKYCRCITHRFEDLWKSWTIYFNHRTRNAGIGFSCIYLTVLGFDSITTGYAYSQGVPESVLGILGAIGAIVGLGGSITFPFLVKCMGVERTGLYGFGLKLACLTLCVASIWAPGSPFKGDALFVPAIEDPFVVHNVSSNSTGHLDYKEENITPHISVILLMSGIIAARFGMWIANLSVNQVLQNVENDIRGQVNGVQSSMNMIFDASKFGLVIVFPRPQTFGFLVCISFVAGSLGWLFYASYSRQERGHLLPFHGKRIYSISNDNANANKLAGHDNGSYVTSKEETETSSF